MTLKLSNIKPDDYILAIRAAKSFMDESKPIGIRHGTIYSYAVTGHMGAETAFYVYRTKTLVVVRYTSEWDLEGI